ncbi:MAG: hypothetical protein GY715_05445 [Planctomycetes bacterium]|nr:hypothetical protein [Planctomycetota bacterium]
MGASRFLAAVALSFATGCAATPEGTGERLETPAYVLPKWTVRDGYVSNGAELWVAGYHLGTDD